MIDTNKLRRPPLWHRLLKITEGDKQFGQNTPYDPNVPIVDYFDNSTLDDIPGQCWDFTIGKEGSDNLPDEFVDQFGWAMGDIIGVRYDIDNEEPFWEAFRKCIKEGLTLGQFLDVIVSFEEKGSTKKTSAPKTDDEVEEPSMYQRISIWQRQQLMDDD